MKLTLVGIPSFAGAFVSGTELAPAHLRSAGLLEALAQRGITVSDLGDLPLPVFLPRHNVPPVRNWPAARMVWDAIAAEGARWFGDDCFTLVLGGDCSIVTGTAGHLAHQYGDMLYVIALDAHVDAVKPDPSRCVGAAASGLWFLAAPNAFAEPVALPPSNLVVLGCQTVPEESFGIGTVTLDQLREQGLAAAVQRTLASLPADARVLLHFDVDVIGKADMPAAYAPSETGLSASECQAVLAGLLADPRVIGMEVTEFSALRDGDGTSARRLVEVLAAALGAR